MHLYSHPLVLIDVETTGISPIYSRIIDIACIRIEKGKETKRFVSLVDPEQALPLFIQSLTGISPEDLKDAPTFHQIAEAIEEICEGAIVVAHNARFDYSFIKAEMEKAGRKFQKKTFCTVKLSRKLYPKEVRHDLSSIIARYGFTCTARHRALGDTEVLVQFLDQIAGNFSHEEISIALAANLQKTAVPSQIDPSVIASLPEKPGVYTFFGTTGETLYIGRSKHLRTRVLSHFADAHRSGKEMRLWQETATIEYEETVSELGAALLELYKIKNESPTLNRLSRRTQALWTLKKNESKESYTTFTLEKCARHTVSEYAKIYGIFRTKEQAIRTIRDLCELHGFCPKLMGIEKGKGECFSVQLKKCSGACRQSTSVDEYNQLLEQAFADRKIALWPLKGAKTLRFSNEETERTEVFIIDNWILKKATVYENEEPRNFFLEESKQTFFDYEVYKVLTRYLFPHASYVIPSENRRSTAKAES